MAAPLPRFTSWCRTVTCSFSDKDQKVRIPAGFDMNKAELVLKNYDTIDPGVLKPYETRVYLLKK